MESKSEGLKIDKRLKAKVYDLIEEYHNAFSLHDKRETCSL